MPLSNEEATHLPANVWHFASLEEGLAGVLQ